MSTTEPRALTAALQSPAFVTKGAGAALHLAARHVERWAPEEGASRSRPLRNLGFVDRLVSPWIESAQRSASLRMFSQYVAKGAPERTTTSNVSWVFPRPWYQDELDWMAAARQAGAESAMQESSAPSMLTTRGTYVAPTQAHSSLALPSALYEYVAPSLSVARPDAVAGSEAYSPLVPFAATQAAHVMARAVAPLGDGASRMSPGLRAVLTTMLERAATTREATPTRAAMSAPELVTSPAPRPVAETMPEAMRVAEQYAEQHAQLAEVQRMARVVAEREVAARVQAPVIGPAIGPAIGPPAPAPTMPADSSAQLAEIRAAQQRAIEQRRAELQRRQGDARREDSQERAAAAAAERARIEERVAQRIAQTQRQEALRLHEQSREAAARDARSAAIAPTEIGAHAAEPTAPQPRVAAEIAAAVAALPPELAAMVTAGISARPERAAQAMAELGDALRSIELIARNTAAGGTIETTRGPRIVMPAGLGGLVSTVERTTAPSVARPLLAAPTTTTAIGESPRMPAMTFIAPARASAPSAIGAAASTMPAALSHVAWSDRWLARFAGARPQSLEVLAAAGSPGSARMQILASAAPNAVFVAPMFEDRSGEGRGETGLDVGFGGARTQEVLPTLRGGPAPAQPVVRFADDAETPDDLLAAIAMSAGRSRATTAVAATPPRPTLPMVDPDRYHARDTLADLVAHAAPMAPSAGLSAQLASSPFAPALRHLLPLGSAPSFDVRALFGAGLSATYLGGLLDAPAREMVVPSDPITRTALDFEATYLAPSDEPSDELAAQATAPLTTLRSALLSWDVETLAAAGASIETRASAPTVAAASAPLARTMVDSLSLPMLGDTATAYDSYGDAAHATTYTAPGMIAERAQAWSVAQERSSSDLAFDFVTPELVLAARVYGLGPAEAAQAMRLAVAGPGQLSAMAGAVDRTFVQAMAIEAERRGDKTRVVTAYPIAAGGETAAPIASETAPASGFAPTSTSFGVARRTPRGAFLWPSATTAALGLSAAAPDGEQSMSIAALELLAAQSVAELGTYTALGELDRGVRTLAGTGAASAAVAPHDEDVLDSASALVPASRRDKFQALYVALSQTSSGRSWSPAARAARALALAGRGEDTISARERATVAWDVLPMVVGDEEPMSTGDAAARTARQREQLRALDPVFVESRPGLASLSARAGEALGSYVSSGAAPAAASSATREREVGAVLRAPTAAQELVQTGRPAARTGGGEVEIPAWFEQAARKMFESKSGVASDITLAELTLVNAAPPTQVAASSRVGGGGPAPVAVSPTVAAGVEKEAIDIEKVANDVYREVLVLMDLARARNGEPYL